MEEQENSSDEIPEKSSNRLPEHLPAVLTVLLVCLAPLVAGYVVGFSSPASASLQDGHPGGITLNPDQITWFGSIVMLTSLLGCVTSASCMEKIGRKKAILIQHVIYLIGWLMMISAQSTSVLFIGRSLCGVGFGFTITVVPVYLGEVGPPYIRGSLGTLFNIAISLGILLAFGIGAVSDWRTLAEAAGGLVCLAILSNACIPESPYWLLKRDNLPDAIRSFKFLHGGKKYLGEIKKRISEFQTSSTQPKAKFSAEYLRKSRFYKPILIVVCLHIFQHFTGVNAIVFYAHSIFKKAGFENEHLPSIMVGLTQAVVMFFTMHLVEKLGRKKSLIISSLGVAVCNAILGLCLFRMSENGLEPTSSGNLLNSTGNNVTVVYGTSPIAQPDVRKVGETPVAAWIALLSCLLFMAFFALGLGPIAYLALGEVLPMRVRGVGCAIATSVNGISAFIVVKTFHSLSLLLTPHGVFWSFSCVALLSTAFAWRCFPETRGKSLIEIEALFDNKNTVDNDSDITNDHQASRAFDITSLTSF